MKILFITLLLFLFNSNIHSQYNPSNGILVYFNEGIERVELEKKDAKINSERISRLLEHFKIDIKNVVSAFPKFSQDDTLRVLKNGHTVKIANYAKIFQITVPTSVSRVEVIDSLLKNSMVLYAEPDGFISVDVEPDDHKFSEQWNMNNEGQTGGTYDADIDASEAWDIFTGSSSVKIGIIDRGVDRNHPDLLGKVSGSTSFSGDHGTHVAGIAAAKANNQVSGQYFGVVGVDWNAQIIAKKVTDYTYNGDAHLSQVINEAVNEGATILNCSWSFIPHGRKSTTVRLAFADAYKMNRIAVTSAGNDGNNGNKYLYPGGYKHGIIVVGSTDHNDQIANTSNHNDYVDVAAPGVGIISSINGTGFGSKSGTSMAAPIVSGIASLLKGFTSNPFSDNYIPLENDDIENIIKISAEDKGVYGWDPYYGEGRVNAKEALVRVRAPYVLEQHSATGAALTNLTGPHWVEFYGVDGILDGGRLVYRYEAIKTVNLNSELLDKHVWGRGLNTEGLSDENPNFGMGFCEVISTTSTTATLRTYIYTHNPFGSPPSYIPNHPMFLTFEYSVSGYKLPTTPTISMSGGIGDNPTLTISGGGSGVDYYVLKKEYDFGSGFNENYVNPASSPYTDNNVQITRFGGDLVARYSVKAVDRLGNESDFSNTVSTNGQSQWKKTIEFEESDEEKEYELNSNYPNPFNPTTQISYQIPENSFVSLVVYNTLGQEVATLVNQHQTSGKYSVQFNATNLPSGLYVYKLRAGEFNSAKKMLLTK